MKFASARWATPGQVFALGTASKVFLLSFCYQRRTSSCCYYYSKMLCLRYGFSYCYSCFNSTHHYHDCHPPNCCAYAIASPTATPTLTPPITTTTATLQTAALTLLLLLLLLLHELHPSATATTTIFASHCCCFWLSGFARRPCSVANEASTRDHVCVARPSRTQLLGVKLKVRLFVSDLGLRVWVLLFGGVAHQEGSTRQAPLLHFTQFLVDLTFFTSPFSPAIVNVIAAHLWETEILNPL